MLYRWDFKFKSKLKATALFYAVSVAVLIAVISGSVVLYSYLSQVFIQHTETDSKLQVNAGSGLNLLLSSSNPVGLDETSAIDLFGEGVDSVVLKRMSWGLFEVGVARAVHRNNSFSKVIMAGFEPNPEITGALYLSDNNKPLSVCGFTKIKGDAFLPEAGIKRAYIEGKTFSGVRLVEGNIKKSKSQLPEINKDLIKKNLTLLSGNIEMNESQSAEEPDAIPDMLQHSFYKATKVFYQPQKAALTQNLKGNIIVISDQPLFISKQARLSDIIVYAPAIMVEPGFEGNLQLFAYDSVIIGRNVHLQYPSAVGLIRTSGFDHVPEIFIDEYTVIDGEVFIYSEKQGRKQPRLSLKKNALVSGLVYVDGMVELKGDIYGSLACKKFILKTPSSIYENHLLDAKIDFSELSGYYAGSSLLASGKEKKIVKWLY